MPTTYHPHKVRLSEAQKKSLLDAMGAKTATILRLKLEDISGGDTLHLTETQINRIKRAASAKKGVDLKLSKAQISHMSRLMKEAALAATQTSSAAPYETLPIVTVRIF